jgi:hypothetical protein
MLLIAAGPGCSSCGKESDRDPTTTASSFEVAPGRLEPAWSWKTVDARHTAMPSECRLLSAPLRHARKTQGLLFVASAGDVGTLAVATGEHDPESVTSTRGLVTLGIESPAKVRDVPWLRFEAPPVMASSSKGWIALLSEQDAFGPKTKAWLWREGGKLDVLADGDQLSVVDARCDGSQCLVLTTRAADVATRGASLWMGDAGAPSEAFTRVDVNADQVGEGALPSGIVRWDGATKSAVVLFDEPKHTRFVRVDAKGVHDAGKVERGVVLIDATSTRDANVVVMTRGEPDANGCVGAGGKVEIAVPGHASAFLPSTVPPASGYARSVGEGAFVTWIAPLNCRATERKVVYGVVLGADGQPLSTAMAMGNADGHAIATHGDEVHVWLRDPEGVTWLRAKCSTTRPDAP